ncbi:MAG: hypothetical protein QME28_01040 [Candidatus Saccharicenans sp.]|nr:hypothetical protein [Candidatus Saccharicenans sp.]
MDEKDINKMRDEQLKEFIRKFYSELDRESDCSVCPLTSCPRRRKPLRDESGEDSGEIKEEHHNQTITDSELKSGRKTGK